jgi:glycosyltransferase involved in cell wall biosynthesis
MAEVVRRLLENKQQLEEMAVKARQQAEKFSWSMIAHRLRDLYEALY